MNWTEIEKKYPPASDACRDWLEKKWSVIIEVDNENRLGYRLTDGVHAVVMFIPIYGNRWLYDFFDEQGIYVSCMYLSGSMQYMIEEGKREYSAKSNWEIKNRKEVEEEAFSKAFEILTDRLNK